MKDIDFEELDRAVSSLLSDTPAQSNAKDDSEPQEKVVDLGGSTSNVSASATTTQPAVVPLPTVPIAKPAPTPASSPITSQPSLAGRRSSGQFMDLVHTSSNMRRPTAEATPLAPTPIPAPVTPLITPTPTPASAPTPVPTVAVQDTVVEASNAPESALIEDKPLESPFIPGTVVDKRPLGAFSDGTTEQPVDKSDEAVASTTSEPDAEKTEVHEEAKAETEKLPDELQDELLKIESDESATKSADEKPTEEPKPAPVAGTSETPTSQPNGSIAQQYEEHPSTGEQTSGAIYNTDNYHKSLVVPKKKSGWLWVLLIVLLIILGAAAGVGFFIYIAPNL